ncbi:MAG: DUF485 domain-containing protein [Acidobacteria bacterium]|nr:DUF485 domain-containing protein [Acidobacteriota bacterium]
MKQAARQMLDSPEFKRMVAKRWTFSVILTIALFVIYYGYIVLIAVDKPLMAQKIGEVTTLGIPLGVAVIVLSWVLTAVYVAWANSVHDPEVRDLKSKVQ